MKSIDSAIERPMLVSLIAISIGILCAAAYLNLPLREVPNIQIPYVMVETDYPGAAPEEVESLVTKPVERKISELEDLDVITSMSSRGRSYIGVEFLSGTDVDEKVRQVRDKASETKDELPETAGAPIVEGFRITNRPVLFVFVYGHYDLYRLGKMAEDLRDELETVRGCSSIEILGDLKREIQVQLDPSKLNAHLIPIGQVISALKQQNLDMPGGIVKAEDAGRLVRNIGRFRTAQDIGDVIVAFRHRGAIRVRDIASIEDGLEDAEEEFRVNGQECVALAVYISEKADLVDMVGMIKERLAQVRQILPPDVQVETAGDLGQMIRTMTNQLKLNALIGGMLVVLVLVVGMGFRSSLMVSLAIPFSILIACGILYALGMTLTGVAIFSLILALGLVVDGAIIVGENIYRHMEEGLSGAEAAKVGIHEVAGAVFCADLTTIVAFLPMMFMSGPTGQYVSVIPKVVAGAVAGSLFVDHVVLPAVAAKFMRARVGKKRMRNMGIAAPHLRILSRALRYRWITMGIVAVVFAASLLLIPVIGTELFPKTDTSRLWITVQMPIGTTLQRTNAVARTVESRLKDMPDVDKYACSVGMMGMLDTSFGASSSRSENVFEFIVELVERDKRERKIDEIMFHLRRMLADIPDARIDIKQRVEGPPVGADIAVRIKGQDLNVLRTITHDVAGKLKLIDGAADVRSDQEESQPEIQVNIDREDASSLGLTPEAISSTVAVAINGIVATTFRDQDEEIDVRVQFPPSNRRGADDIRNLRILTPSGNLVVLTQVADIREAEGLTHISRRDLKRIATVRCRAEGRLVSKIVSDLKAEVADMPSSEAKELALPQGYSIEYGGENEETAESFRSLGKAMAVAIVLVLVILMAQFRSIIQPIVIIITIPLSFIGVILGLIVTDNPFGMMAFIGVVGLSGIVVNDAIVLVTYINTLRDRGMERKAAILQAAQTRFRPIMMTTITTIAGLLPTTLGLGGGVDFWAPLGWSIIWGLMTATLLTLVVVPVVYSLVEDAKELRGRS
jgi:CzcA family heavy metal efflux pump